MRVPAIAGRPGRAPAGRISDGVWSFADFLPTAEELGRPQPRGLPRRRGGDRKNGPMLKTRLND